MTIVTGPSSNISLEAWLPDQWTGRLLVIGNGGLDGCIHYEDMNYGSSTGFATVGTNNGHDGVGGQPFYKQPGVVEDYVYRAIHTASSVVKDTSTTYYGKSHTKSYYLGCSTGGRQGFKEAQSFPQDFDGIVAGAPAFNFNNLIYWSGNFYNITGKPGSSTFLTSSDWNLVYADILKQCDQLDGVPDGVLEDPELCQYRPESLICAPGQKENCITATQAATVRLAFSPVYGPSGSLIFPRLQPGANATGISFTGRPFQYTVDWFRYVVYNNTAWDPTTLGLKDWVAADRLNPFNVATWEGDLSQFKQHGGKLLHYHGLQDPIISSDNSIRYYNHVSRTMGLPAPELDSFYRFFRISGMGHCVGGTGASSIGNTKSPAAGFDPQSNILAALVKWVEEGRAPETIRGTKYAEGIESPGKILAQRDHCKYPMRNTYRGHGDPNVPCNWHCV
ncbi:Feruloyl esterase [Conoideocrella luteorostrata]|uniref:Carboxylic ester hydrolase n=1 Tax=Conoideocrella luteorostrata TaxID=1105319 RepID=A0AAJ0FNC4_9HYPO|nr:Feruloyl esterase [Conoideocrella luteorostrata]